MYFHASFTQNVKTLTKTIGNWSNLHESEGGNKWVWAKGLFGGEGGGGVGSLGPFGEGEITGLMMEGP